MIVVDSSAVVAVLLKEPGWEPLRDALLSTECAVMSAATLLEAGMVMEGRLGQAGGLDLDRLIAEAAVEIVPFDASQTAIARDAFRRFGKGRHPAGLNFGDCFAYALASHMGGPLLFVGGDFSRTDVESAVGT